MNTPYTACCGQLAKTPKKWLVTGVAGFTYAASSTYGDHPVLSKVGDAIGTPRSVCNINGDDKTSHDFCISNSVQANLLAATSESAESRNQVYDVALGDNTLFGQLRHNLAAYGVRLAEQPIYCDCCVGDMRNSQANINKVRRLLGYAPTYWLAKGDAVLCSAGEMMLNRRPSTWNGHRSLSS